MNYVHATYHKMDSQYKAAQLTKEKRRKKEADDFALKPFSWLQQISYIVKLLNTENVKTDVINKWLGRKN
jgi:hypothetical protein